MSSAHFRLPPKEESTARSEMQLRVSAFDWSSTPLGPREQWPNSLKVAVGICLNSRFPMFVWWGSQLINIYNDGYIPMLGARHPAALGRPAQEIWSDIWDVVGPQAQLVLERGGSTWNERVRLIMERHGYTEETWFTWSYSPIHDESENIGGLFCAVTEETQRVLAERERNRVIEQWKLAQERSRTILESITDGFFSVDSQWRFTYVNRQAERVLERQPGDLVGKSLWEQYPGLIGSEFERIYRRAAQEQVAGSVTAFYPDHQRWYEVHAYPAMEGISIYFRDVTERVRSEQALRQSEECYRQFFEAVGVGKAELDGGTLRFLRVNRKLCQILGYTSDELLAGTADQLTHPDDLPMVARGFARLRSGETSSFEVEKRSILKDGSHIWVQATFTCYRTIDGNLRFLVALQDISARRQMEADRDRLLDSERLARAQAERANEAKSQFIAVLSHELRTPLTPVLLTLSLMENSPAMPEALREDLSTIRRNVELESRLISDLLDLTRITSGKLHLELQDVDLHLIVRAAVAICQREASARLDVDLRANRSTVRGDGTRLQQIFWNLINNAQKFTPPQGSVSVRSFDLPDGRIRVEVSDTGAGIDAATLPKLFNAFEQGEARQGRQQAGLGLGLAISRRLAEAHGGSVTATSGGRGQGATFTVDLPLIPTPSAARPAENIPRDALTRYAQPLSVLLVEDHEQTLRVLTRLLSGLGHRVTGANSQATALSAAEVDGFDLIISDLGLPDGSGLDLMRQLRHKYAGRAIALTGYGMESDIAASREAGFAEHLIKPVDLDQLSAAISRVSGQASGRPVAS